MFLALKLHRSAQTDIGSIDFMADEEIAGWLLAFHRYEDAVEYTQDETLVVEITEKNTVKREELG